MKKFVSAILLFGIYLNLIVPLVPPVFAQKTSGKTTKTNMNVNLPDGLQFRLSEGEEGAEKRDRKSTRLNSSHG